MGTTTGKCVDKNCPKPNTWSIYSVAPSNWDDEDEVTRFATAVVLGLLLLHYVRLCFKCRNMSMALVEANAKVRIREEVAEEALQREEREAIQREAGAEREARAAEREARLFAMLNDFTEREAALVDNLSAQAARVDEDKPNLLNMFKLNMGSQKPEPSNRKNLSDVHPSEIGMMDRAFAMESPSASVNGNELPPLPSVAGSMRGLTRLMADEDQVPAEVQGRPGRPEAAAAVTQPFASDPKRPPSEIMDEISEEPPKTPPRSTEHRGAAEGGPTGRGPANRAAATSGQPERGPLDIPLDFLASILPGSSPRVSRPQP